MATLSLVGGEGQFTWTISGLSNWFASNQYRTAGVTTDAFSEGATSISGIIARVTATADPQDATNPYSVSGTAIYASGTYTLYGFAQGSDGTYWPAGSGSVTISSGTSGIARWDWQSSADRQTAYKILTGELPTSAGFKASVWNDLVRTLRQCVYHPDWGESWGSLDYGEHKSLPYNQCLVSAGMTLSADLYNTMVLNCGTWSNDNYLLEFVAAGDELTGAHILNFADQLNKFVAWCNS